MLRSGTFSPRMSFSVSMSLDWTCATAGVRRWSEEWSEEVNVIGSGLAWVGATTVGSSGFACLFVRWELFGSLVCVTMALVDDII
jgi:hypothetical protein